jgi:Fe-S-cluster-containing hydrogenase component 2
MSPPEFRAAHCTRFRYRYSECHRCADACPHQAIELSDEGVTVSGAACRHCALCAAVCPTEALMARDAAPIDLLRRAVKLGSARIACAPSGQKGDEILPCLGALGAATLALLASRGIPVVLAGASYCAKCPHGSTGASALALNLDGARILRDAAGNEGWADVTLADDGDAPARSTGHDDERRQLFRRFLSPGDKAILPADVQSVPLKAVRFARPVSTAGRELLQILFEQKVAGASKPAKEAPSALAHHGALFTARIEILPGCTACEVCARACPAAAIEIREHSAAWELTFRQSRCTGCGLCVEACQPHVLHYAENLGDDPGEKAARTLHAFSKQRCSLCDRFFISAAPAETCPVCEGDNADFAALFG